LIELYNLFILKLFINALCPVKPQKVLVQVRIKISITTGGTSSNLVKETIIDIQGDGRPFWRLIVSEATGCADDDYFEEVYEVSIHLMHLL
jgi:hypothetical protein